MSSLPRIPEIDAALDQLSAAVRGVLPEDLIQLLQVRVSQINRCAWCVRFHVGEAERAGISTTKLLMLPVWDQTTGLYSAKERAGLEAAELMTATGSLSSFDSLPPTLREEFSAEEAAHVVGLIASINARNRIAIARGVKPRFAE